MSKFHVTVRDLFKDVYLFLIDTLPKEPVSCAANSRREQLLLQLRALEKEYPELQLNLDESDEIISVSNEQPPSSPLPYVDMNGGSPYKIPATPLNERDSYDVCSFKETKYDSVEIQSTTESEDYISEETKNLPDIAAKDLYACEKCGYLEKKKRDSLKGWLNPFQKRWCAVKDGVFYYYEKTSDRKQKGSIALSGYEVRRVPEVNKDGKKYNFCFELVCPGRRTYQFSAPSDKDLQQWITSIEHNNQVVISNKPLNQLSLHSSNDSKETHSEPVSLDIEDIYETVEDEDIKESNEKQEIVRNCVNGSFLIPFFEEVNNEQILNYDDWYVGLWDCFGSDDTELSFYRGDLIHVVSKEYDNYSWWIGESKGKVGFVPKSYLMEAYEAC